MIPEMSFPDTVKNMLAIGDMLQKYTYPVADFKVEQDVAFMRQRQVTVDGYELLVCYSRADYGDHVLDSLQVQGLSVPFLPFGLVCKVGRAFLGDRSLCYVSFFKNNRKIYCWMVKTKEGELQPPDEGNTPESYDGFEYTALPPGTVDLV